MLNELKYTPSNGNLDRIREITKYLTNNENCIIVFDKNFNIKFINQCTANVFNLTVDEIINRNILDLIKIKLG